MFKITRTHENNEKIAYKTEPKWQKIAKSMTSAIRKENSEGRKKKIEKANILNTHKAKNSE